MSLKSMLGWLENYMRRLMNDLDDVGQEDKTNQSNFRRRLVTRARLQ